MPATAAPLPAAIAHLAASCDRVSALVGPGFGLAASGTEADRARDGGGDTGSHGSNDARRERSRQRARQVRTHLRWARGALDALGCTVEMWGWVRAERRGMVAARSVAAVLGAGAVVLDSLESALRKPGALYAPGARTGDAGVRREEGGAARLLRRDVRGDVSELMAGVDCLWLAVHRLVVILESSSGEEAVKASDELGKSVMEILGGDGDLLREIKKLYPEPGRADSVATPASAGPDTPRSSEAPEYYNIVFLADSDSGSETGPPTPTSSDFSATDTALAGSLATLADVASPSDVLVPIVQSPAAAGPAAPAPRAALRVITVSTAGVDISPLPPDVDAASHPQPEAVAALSANTVFQLPEVTDRVMLDFFRRAAAVSRFAAHFSDTATGEPAVAAPCAHKTMLQALSEAPLRELCADLYDELVGRNVEDRGGRRRAAAGPASGASGERRARARERMAGLSDGGFVKLLKDVMGELETRVLVQMHVLQASARESTAEALLELRSDRWSVEAMRR